jgi:hypothetical protein
MNGWVAGIGLTLMVLGIIALIFGVGGKGRVESRFMNLSRPSGLVILGIGAVMFIIGAAM